MHSNIRVTAEQLDEVKVLKLMDCFKGPIPPRHVEIGVDPGPVFPVRRKPLDHGVQQVFLVPQFVRGSKLNVAGIKPGHLERPFAVSQFPGMQHYIWAGRHVLAEIIHQHAASPPAQRIAIRAGDMQRRFVGPVLPGQVYIGVQRHLALKIAARSLYACESNLEV